MKLTPSRKIYLAVLGVGVCAFVYDQFGGPAPTVAAAVDLAVSTFAAAPSAVAPAAPPAAQVDLVTRLNALAARTPAGLSRDVFVPAPAWVASQDTTEAASAERAERFRRGHTLKAVVAVGRRGQAMVDGRLLTVGDRLDGWRLLSVDAVRATFGAGASRVALTLDPQSLSAAGDTRP